MGMALCGHDWSSFGGAGNCRRPGCCECNCHELWDFRSTAYGVWGIFASGEWRLFFLSSSFLCPRIVAFFCCWWSKENWPREAEPWEAAAAAAVDTCCSRDVQTSGIEKTGFCFLGWLGGSRSPPPPPSPPPPLPLFVALEQLHRYSVCGPAKENWMKKSQNMLVWFSKMVLAQHFCIGCWGW